jgi:hypothetical protein
MNETPREILSRCWTLSLSKTFHRVPSIRVTCSETFRILQKNFKVNKAKNQPSQREFPLGEIAPRQRRNKIKRIKYHQLARRTQAQGGESRKGRSNIVTLELNRQLSSHREWTKRDLLIKRSLSQRLTRENIIEKLKQKLSSSLRMHWRRDRHWRILWTSHCLRTLSSTRNQWTLPKYLL